MWLQRLSLKWLSVQIDWKVIESSVIAPAGRLEGWVSHFSVKNHDLQMKTERKDKMTVDFRYTVSARYGWIYPKSF